MNDIVLVVYDNTKGFSRFLKKNFSKNYEMYFWNSHNENFNCNNKLLVAFIQINSLYDLKNCLNIINKADYVFWSSAVEDIKISLLNLDNFIFLDMQLTRFEMLKKIDFHMDTFTAQVK